MASISLHRPAADLGRAFAAALLALALADDARASCNVIPAATQDFRGALGSANRPFASPGDYVEVRVRPPICDDTSTGFVDLDGDGSRSDDHVVTVLFVPPSGTANATVLAESCAAVDLASCTAQLGGGTAECVQVNGEGEPPGIVVTDSGELQVRFPDSDARLASGICPGDPSCNDDRTFSGPAKIVVTRRGAALACGLASSRCVDLGGTTLSNGVVACLDELYTRDGTCRTTTALVDPVFGHFSALPPPNDVEQLINAAGVTELHFTTDAAGNVLLPIDYLGVLLRVEGVPVPQLVRATTSVEDFPGSGTKIDLPSSVFVASYAPEGVVLPPVFTPLSDPSSASDAILFGSADAPRSVLRITRRGCQGGPDAGHSCTQNAHCSSNVCDAALFDFSTRYASGVGPVSLAGGGGGFYTASLDAPISLESVAQAKAGEAFAFVLSEAVDGVDRNGDGDVLAQRRDIVLTLRDPVTGALEPIGPGSSEGRAVVRIREERSAFPAVETEGDLVAFLESEPAQGDTDANSNGSVFESVLRLFRVDQGDVTDMTPAGLPTADTALRVNARSLAFADAERLLFVTPEAREADQTTTRVSVASWGTQADDSSDVPSLSADARFVAFASSATNLVEGDTNEFSDVFVHDTQTGSTERVSVTSSGSQVPFGGMEPVISADGRFVAFTSAADLEPPDTNGFFDVFVHDRQTGDTERVSLSSVGAEGEDFSSAAAISSDGRFVTFESGATNLAPGDTNGQVDIFVHDRQTGQTTRVSVDSQGAEGTSHSQHASISADGRFVAFHTLSVLVGNDTNGSDDVFVHDRLTGETTRVSVSSLGTQGSSGSTLASISADGRHVAFESQAPNLVPGDTNAIYDAFVHDRQSGVTSRVSVDSVGVEGFVGSFNPVISGSGRFVAFTSLAANLVANDTDVYTDVFLHDRQTGHTTRVSVGPSGAEANQHSNGEPALARDGRVVAFTTSATNLITPEANGFSTDVLIRSSDPTALSADRSGDGDLDDQVLRVADVGSGPPASITDLCPASQVAAANGRAAFLRPESAGATTNAACTGASLAGPDLNADGDVVDEVVHVWDGSTVTNLRCAATAIAVSDTRLAALVSEAGEALGPPPVCSMNTDSDCDDAVLFRRSPVGAGGATCMTSGWSGHPYTGRALAVAGDHVVLLSSEADEDSSLNGDGDADDAVLRLVDGITGALVPFEDAQGDPLDPPAALEFVLGDTLVAFRVPESGQSNASPPACSRNGDTDCDDAVLHVADLVTGEIVSSGQAAVPCQLTECDPRRPYRVSQDTVRFLTLEVQQGTFPACDLNDDGDCGDLLVQVFNVLSGETRVVAEVAEPDPETDPADMPSSDPLATPSETDPADQSSQVVVAEGRCVEDSGVACTVGVPGACPGGEFCFASAGETEGSCVADTGLTCRPDAAPGEQGCLAAAICVTDLAVLAIADRDADQVPDAHDDCPDAANTDQADLDEDGVGDVCDLQTCGDDVEQLDEECDDGDLDSGDGCDANCTATACGNGSVTAGEACDDGNLLAGDGCSAACQVTTACNDGVDNDGDGAFDHPADPGCASAADPGETTPALDCDDGDDNDGDGLTDSGEDMGCFNAGSAIENPQCQDGIQNDFDGLIDWDGGASAGVPPGQQTAPDPDCVGRPHRDREKTGACGLGFEVAFAVAALSALRRRRRSRAPRGA